MVVNKGVLRLAILSFLIMLNGFAMAAESNKDKLKKMLDNANKPQAASSIPNDFLTGLWVGVYDYHNRTSNTPPANTFSMVFEQTPEQINAIILEPAPGNPEVYAQFAEAINATVEGKTLSFTKKYQAGNTVQYSLTVDVQDKVMSGTWKINDQTSGPVMMWRMNASELQ